MYFLGFIEGVLNDSLKCFENAKQKVSCTVKVYTVSICFYHEFKTTVYCLVRTGYLNLVTFSHITRQTNFVLLDMDKRSGFMREIFLCV